MLQAGRSKNAGGYRFGFQGQEADNKIGGLGQHLNYTFRNYDSWIIRFGATDLLEDEYPFNSPYAFSENRVIDAVELEGLERRLVMDPMWKPNEIPELGGSIRMTRLRNGQLPKTGNYTRAPYRATKIGTVNNANVANNSVKVTVRKPSVYTQQRLDAINNNPDRYRGRNSYLKPMNRGSAVETEISNELDAEAGVIRHSRQLRLNNSKTPEGGNTGYNVADDVYEKYNTFRINETKYTEKPSVDLSKMTDQDAIGLLSTPQRATFDDFRAGRNLQIRDGDDRYRQGAGLSVGEYQITVVKIAPNGDFSSRKFTFYPNKQE